MVRCQGDWDYLKNLLVESLDIIPNDIHLSAVDNGVGFKLKVKTDAPEIVVSSPLWGGVWGKACWVMGHSCSVVSVNK